MKYLITLALIITFTTMSCRKNESSCYEPKSVNAVINFSTKVSRQVDTLIDSVVVDTILVNYRDTSLPLINALSLGVDSPLFIYSTRGSSYIGLLLNPNKNFTTYRIAYDTIPSSSYDTLTIFHTTRPSFINNACGYTNFFNIDSIQYHSSAVDSFIIINRDITRESGIKNRLANFYFFNQ